MTSRRLRALRLGALLSVLLLLATACGGSEQVSSSEPSPEAKASPSPEPEPDPCPLTGAAAPDDVDLSRPVMAIKIDNASPARPQAGLESADIVYEELVEGGITRFLAIFHCQDAERLGPTRSARMVDPDLVVQYAPVLFAFSGANDTVLGKVSLTQGVVDLQHGKLGSAYFRQSGRPAPHNLFTSTDAIRAAEAARDLQGSPANAFDFDPDLLTAQVDDDGASAEGAGRMVEAAEPAEGTPEATPGEETASPTASPFGEGKAVRISYSAGGSPVEYTYDPQAGVYLRSMGGSAHNAEDGSQLSAVNVLVFKVKVTPGLVISAAGARSPDIEVTGEGEAVVLRAGKAVQGTWRRASLSDPFEVVDPSGDSIELAPGNMWINLLPSDRPIEVE